MQGESSRMDSFPKSADIGQGSVSNSNMMSRQTRPSNMLHPIESRLSNSMMSSGETTHISSTIHDGQNLNSWTSGGNSSGFNLQNEFNDDRMKVDVWSSPFSIHPGNGARSVERHSEPTNNNLPWGGDIGSSHNEVRNGFSFLRGSSSNSIPQSENLNAEHEGSSGNGRQGMGAVVDSNLTMSSGFDMEQTSSADALSDKTATSSGSGDYMEENDGGSSSSVRIWGISCKRKALEGTSRQSFPGESSSSFPQPETGWHASTSTYGQSSLSLSTPACISPPVAPPESHNVRIGAGRRALTYNSFPSSGVTENLESPLTNLGRRATAWTPQDSVPFHLLPAGSSGHPNIYPTHQLSSPSPFTDSADLRSTATLAANFRAPQGQSHTMQTPGSSRSIDLFPWVGVSTSRLGSLSNSSFHGESNSAGREDLNLRSSTRYSGGNPTFLPGPEMGNSSQDPTTWNLGSGITSTSGVPSTIHVGPVSSISFPNPAHTPPHNPPTENQQRVSEFAPWSLFPNAASESGTHAGHFSSSPSGFPSQEHTALFNGPNRRGHHQPNSRSPFFLERLGNNSLGTPHSLRALADDMEGRRRLITEIRQVLNAMRRNDFRVEDHMLLDPFIVHPLPEVHDRHRDMRLDVDNMSYEELLALEERMGDVSTGLGEAAIMKLMKQRKYASMISESPPDMEPCCVCQEHYADGDDMGTLDCGHDFHMDCIKQWLLQKNLCPICKTSALQTEKEDK